MEASTKVNKYKSVRVRCMRKKFEKLNVNKRYCVCALESKMDQFSARQDAYEISKRVLKNVRDIGGHSYRIGCAIWLYLAMVDPLRHPEFTDFQRCVKVIKSQEVGKKWRAEPSKPGIMPVHMFATMQSPCQGVGVSPLLTLQQRDDCIAKFWSAQNNMSAEDAVSTWGECFMDTQALNPDVAGTTYGGRFRRWVENDLPGLWRTNYRAPERGKGKKNVCRPFLQGSCTHGANCKFMHPTSEAQFSKADFEIVCTEFPDKMRGIQYGRWHTTPKQEVEKKDD
eukprot:g18940.t1